MLFPELFIHHFLRNTKLQIHREAASFIHLTGNLYRTTHKLYNIFRNGHTQPGTLYLVGSAVLRPGKGIKYDL